jgi:hypothetical protein
MSASTKTVALRFRWMAPEPIKRLPFAKVLPLLKAGVAAAPDRVDLKLQLTKTLFYTDQMAELVEWLRPAVADNDANPEFLYYLGRSALVTCDNELALNALERAASKGFGSAFSYFAEALHRFDRSDEALMAGLRGLEHSPSDFKAMSIVVRVLLERGATQRLWDLCVDLRARGAWGAYVPSAMALAAATPEQDSEVAVLVDQQRWFSTTQVAVTNNFNQKLAAELLTHKSISPLPSIKSTIGGGSRIDQLELTGGPMALDLLVRIRAAVDSYVAERQAIAGHPMIVHQPTCVALNSWAVMVHHDGHETWHIHPSGWISGVYYVQIPEFESSSKKSPGAIEFGPYPFGFERESTVWLRQQITPMAGMLLLFPSFYGHRTMPTAVHTPRICVAFDVISASEESQ